MATTREQAFRTEFELSKINKALGILAILLTLLIIGWKIVTAPKTVTIDAKHWDCTATEPNGIEARCTNFTMKKYSLTHQ